MHELQPIHTWHVVISGFLQPRGAANGMYSLWRKLYGRFTDYATCVRLCTWNDNHAATAEMIWRSRNGRDPVVKIYAYSWGAGYGAMKLARELAKRSIDVQVMVLSDPIYRSPLWTFSWLAMVDWRVILVPANVRLVKWFRQVANRPRAHDLVPVDREQTLIATPRVCEATTHQYMDDLGEFHDCCLEAAAA